MNSIKISNSRISIFTIPTKSQLESDGTLEWNSTTMILVELLAGNTWSVGYTYGHEGIASLVKTLIEKHVIGQNAFDIPLIWNQIHRAVRNDGALGIAAMAVSAIDVALWDLKAKLLDIPLVKLMGSSRSKIEVYGSGGFTSATLTELQEQMEAWRDQGIRRFKMKVGTHPKDDPSRVVFVRECIGPQNDLMVDGNEAYDITTALRLAEVFAVQNVSWFEQPIQSQDLPGMKELKSKLPKGMVLATGEYIYGAPQALRLIQYRSADVIQLDATRCQGITGFLKAAALCEAANIPISSHCAPTLHVALGCANLGMLHLEYFFDHVRIEQEFFDGVPSINDGFLEPDLSRPGLGITLKSKDLERYQK